MDVLGNSLFDAPQRMCPSLGLALFDLRHERIYSFYYAFPQFSPIFATTSSFGLFNLSEGWSVYRIPTFFSTPLLETPEVYLSSVCLFVITLLIFE
jgi:hypothetical protein